MAQHASDGPELLSRNRGEDHTIEEWSTGSKYKRCVVFTVVRPMTEVQCHKCGYEWDYGGDLERSTCPNCKSTVKVPQNENTD